MTAPIPLTRAIGTTERALQALLLQRLERAALGFADWVALTRLSAGPLPGPALAAALARGHVEALPEALLARLHARGLIAESAQGWALTKAGAALFAPLQAEIAALTSRLETGLSEADLAATRRVLAVLAARATALA